MSQPFWIFRTRLLSPLQEQHTILRAEPSKPALQVSEADEPVPLDDGFT